LDVVFTIVSRNYQAQAQTLMDSLAVAEPGLRRVVVASDGPMSFADPDIEVLDAGDFVPNFAAMSAYYDAIELNTAIKPHAFKTLLARPQIGQAVYLDPDIFVYRPLEAVREGLARAPLVLTPHLTRPLKGEANPSDRVILASGAYNLGFMAVRDEPQITALLDWWGARLEFDCRVDFAAGLFTDQKWMDLAPGFVSDLALLRTPALNLAYWNLEDRVLARTADGWTVDGEPLVFFHFSGFDPARPEVLSKHQDRIRITPRSPLAKLCADYAKVMLANGHASASATPYGHRALPSGRLVTATERRRMLDAARRGEDFGGGLTPEAETWLDAPRATTRSPATPPEAPWLAGSEELAQALITQWPPPAIGALLAARKDLRERFATDEAGLKAWLIGPEALAGRFDPRFLGEVITQDLAARAAAYALGEGLDPQLAAYGLAGRAGWPPAARPALDAPTIMARGVPFPRLFLKLWEARTDLQKLFPLSGLKSRFGFLRWLIGGGLAEVGIDVADLPANVRSHPAWRLAALMSRPAAPLARRPQGHGEARRLHVVETWRPDLALGDEVVFEAATDRFRTAAGDPAAPPARVAQVVFATDPGLAPADAVALLAQGVAWRSAARP
jgi:hypothetical protein